MGVFDKLITKTNINGGNSYHATTKGFCIGIPEAEAEATTASIKLDTFFVDYLDVLKQLNNEKFIVLGRKGTGKSAIGEHVLSLAKNEANMFCDFIKKEDIDIEKIVQIGKEEGVIIERGLLYKWIVLTKFVALFAENQSLACVKGMNYLSDFIKKSRGFINIKNYEVKEIIHQYGLSVSIEYFKRYLSASGNTNKQYKYEKAEFYKLIPDLEKVVTDILKADKDNQYILMFDDLDIGLNLNNQESIDTLTELIRTIKYYNNDIFARNAIESKIIVFLRTDIQKHLIYSADMPKIFSSYATELRWYEDIYKYNEPKLLLRQFINRRISVNFQKKGLVINDNNDPWTSFIDEKSFYGEKTGFKHIIDHTFFRPRDLILFFKDIGSLDLSLPITSNDVNNILMDRYAREMITDIKGELSVNYDANEIESIFDALRDSYGTYRRPFKHSTIVSELRSNGLNNTAKIISDLFDYSLIGNYDENGNVGFKYRETSGQIVELNTEGSYILHYVLQTYFKKN
ncbi:MAG: hypothetical protein IJ057_06040 [Bacteroidales bacterium]|nr:hypothetical protein [Bacteroidales bacterium]